MIDNARVRRLVDALSYFAAYLEGEAAEEGVNVDALLANYVNLRRTMGAELSSICGDLLVAQQSALAEHRQRVAAHMAELFGGIASADLLTVRGYAGVHDIIFEYLARHVGEAVPISRIRVLTGDQVHTERRIRELRDLGFEISWKKAGGEDQYMLAALDVDLDRVAAAIFRSNVRESTTLSGAMRQRLNAIVEKL